LLLTAASLKYTRIIYTASIIRYGGYGGIAYHHVSDKYIALFTHFITCGVGGCLYFGWAVENSSDIQPDTLHADTQGQSGPVFAISYLLGIKLMPRIRNWKDLTLFAPVQMLPISISNRCLRAWSIGI